MKDYLPALAAVLQKFGRIIYLAMKDSDISPEKFSLVDYGGGSGLISLLAAEMRVGSVVYNDIYETSCKDVAMLASVLGLNLKHVVCGDIEDLLSYTREKKILFNALVSHDVIEHVYDVKKHFTSLRRLKGQKFRIVHASGANIENPWFVHAVKKKHFEVEHQTRAKTRGHKDRDTLEAYVDVRRKIISSRAPGVPPEQLEHLARATRGLIKRDIERCVDVFLASGRVPYRMNHPTNTCDPRTGNWHEHLIPLNWLEKMVRENGFQAKIIPGEHYTTGIFPSRLVMTLLNLVITVLHRRGMILSPYYVLFAEST